MIGKLSLKAAVTVKDTVQKKMEERTTPHQSPLQKNNNTKDLEKALGITSRSGTRSGSQQYQRFK